jgi:Cdc6-like AAA superfamily ATPase
METFPRIGLILISTSEAEIRGLVGRRLFSRLRPEYCEFMPYDADRLYEIASSDCMTSTFQDGLMSQRCL